MRLDIAFFFFRDGKMPSPSTRSEGRLELDAVVRRAPRGVGRQRSCGPVERPLERSERFAPGCCPRRGAEVCPLDRGQRGHSLCKRLELQGKKNGPNGIRTRHGTRKDKGKSAGQLSRTAIYCHELCPPGTIAEAPIRMAIGRQGCAA